MLCQLLSDLLCRKLAATGMFVRLVVNVDPSSTHLLIGCCTKDRGETDGALNDFSCGD